MFPSDIIFLIFSFVVLLIIILLLQCVHNSPVGEKVSAEDLDADLDKYHAAAAMETSYIYIYIYRTALTNAICRGSFSTSRPYSGICKGGWGTAPICKSGWVRAAPLAALTTAS
jgi:hypothetical protein